MNTNLSNKQFIIWGICLFAASILLSIFGGYLYLWISDSYFGTYASGWEGYMFVFFVWPTLLVGLLFGSTNYSSKHFKNFFLSGLITTLVILGIGVISLYSMSIQRNRVELIEWAGKLTSRASDRKSTWTEAVAYFTLYDYAGNGRFVPFDQRETGRLSVSQIPVKFANRKVTELAKTYLDEDQIVVLVYDEQPLGIGHTDLKYFRIYNVKTLETFEGQGHIGGKLVGYFTNYRSQPDFDQADFITSSYGAIEWRSSTIDVSQAEGAWKRRIVDLVQTLAQSQEEVTIQLNQIDQNWSTGTDIQIKWIYGSHKP